MIHAIIFLSICLTIMTVLFIVTYARYRKMERETYNKIIGILMDTIEELQNRIQEKEDL